MKADSDLEVQNGAVTMDFGGETDLEVQKWLTPDGKIRLEIEGDRLDGGIELDPEQAKDLAEDIEDITRRHNL